MKDPTESKSWLAQALRYALVLLTIAALDLAAGEQISLWVVYLVPIGLATWNCGVRVGGAVAAGTLALWLMDVIFVGGPFDSTGYALIAVASRGAVLVAEIVLLTRLRRRDVERTVYRSR